MTLWINELMSDKGVCRTAPATPDLLSIDIKLNNEQTVDQTNIF